MKESFKQVTSDKIIRWGMGLASFLIAVEIFLPGLFYFSLPPFIPVFNQMPWGETRLGTKITIFIPVGTTLLFFFINFIFMSYLYTRIPLVSRILSITTLLIALLSLIYTIRTLNLIL